MRPRLACVLLLLGALLLAGCGSSKSTSSTASTAPATSSTATNSSGGAIGPEGMPLETGPPLAPASTTAQGQTVDGIRCAPSEQVLYHIHSHLQVYVNGQSRVLPPAIGMVDPVAQQTPEGPFYGAAGCYYWLHVHAADGVIHVESPIQRIYTLGNFFDVWRQPLTSTQVGPATGKVTAFMNGKPWTASPRAIPLESHFVIQLDVGTPLVPFHNVSFAGTQL